jgi:Helitron helicase-like domain at N-terminus
MDYYIAKRRDWARLQDDLTSLTKERIHNATTALNNHEPVTDPTINSLLHHLRTVGSHDPYSFAQKLSSRSHMKGIIIRQGMTTYWITMNPSDLRNTVVLHLAGVTFSSNAMPRLANSILEITARTSNPVAVAQFFHHICNAVFTKLFHSGSDELGILGKVASHYGMVETNGRGMCQINHSTTKDTKVILWRTLWFIMYCTAQLDTPFRVAAK